MAPSTQAASFVCGDNTASDAEWAIARRDVYDAARGLAAAQKAYDDSVRLAMDMAQTRFNAGTNRPDEAYRMITRAENIRGAGN